MSTRKGEREERRSTALGAEILSCLRRLTHAIDQHSSALAKRYGLTGPQLAVLHALSTYGEVSVSELARRVSLSQPTVTGIIRRMLSKGLVSRRPSEWDRRVVLLSVTPEGHRVLDQAPPLLREPFMDHFSQLDSREQERLVGALREIVSMIELPPFPDRMDPLIPDPPRHRSGSSAADSDERKAEPV